MSHSPGPWRWKVDLTSKHVELINAKGDIVLDFIRYGMGSATPRFSVNGLMEKAPEISVVIPGEEHHAAWNRGIGHPDADLIASAPDLLFERDALRDRVVKMERVIADMLSVIAPCISNKTTLSETIIRDAEKLLRGGK